MSDNKAKVDAILAVTQEVEVMGHSFTLSMPTPEQIRELRVAQFNLANYSDGDMRSEDGLVRLSDYTTKCVAYVLKLDDDDAAALIFATGGEGGGMFKAVQEFLGLSPVEDDGSTDYPS